jgi:hypothetical protein
LENNDKEKLRMGATTSLPKRERERGSHMTLLTFCKILHGPRVFNVRSTESTITCFFSMHALCPYLKI